MFGRNPSVESVKLDDAINRLLDEMDTYGPDSKEYTQHLGSLERLNTLRTGNRPQRMSRDTIAIVGGNLLGILIIVAYEQKHVMVSKSLGFVLKPKNITN